MSSGKILIVEDDMDFLMAMGIRLKASGYSVVSASDGVAAISMARQERPDLVLLDLGLPAGDGFVVIETLKNLLPLAQIPIIVLSARDPVVNKERARQAGAVAYLQKPVENAVLLAAIRKVLGERRDASVG
jgi:DNA-binding response OmpR family regulator